tara:strand:- start:4096 stop:4932 length:837 start_codon:yes stop_codon:yes gene_type:complete
VARRKSEKIKMNIVLFDMDGTLTEARRAMNQPMCTALTRLQRSSYKIGIVSGSDIDYILEQCSILGEVNGFDYSDIDIYPCNGTKHYRYTGHGKLTKVYENNFKEEIGSELFSKLIFTLFELMSNFKNKEYGQEIPLTGNFLDCRGSMINFSPIGRNASQKDRKKWIELDNKFSIRQKLIKQLKNSFENIGIKFKLGGETSIDICPSGWDKTYVLKNFDKNDNVWFVGDRCDKDGNDKELYDAIKLRLTGDSFKTTGPSKTIAIIKNRILQHPGNFKR